MATILITISGCLQLCNLLTIEWDVINRVGKMQNEIKRRVEARKEGKSVEYNTNIVPMIKVSP